MQRLCVLAALVIVGSAHAGEDGFKPLFNGKDLTGWHNVNCAAGTFFVKDKMIITTGKPTGYLRTDKQYENFVLEFEWFHAPTKIRDKERTRRINDLDVHEINVGNSGMFVWGDPLPAVGTGYTRSIEVQVLVGLRSTVPKDAPKSAGMTAYTSQGDLFSIWGARCKPDRPHPLGWQRCLPSADHCKGEYEWNHYKVVANNGALKLSVNGHEVSGVTECNPRKGYLALESEGSECRFKNLKIKELPSTNPKASEICDVDKGWKCLFTGVDLDCWKATDEHKKHWKMNDGVLSYDAKGTAKNPHLWSENSYDSFELVCDWRCNNPGSAGIFVRGTHSIRLDPAKPTRDWNRAVIHLKGNRLSVHVNGKIVTDDIVLPEIRKSGPIAFQHIDGNPVQLRNVFIRELK
jgi:Domain of Unknown Function (DUF1080)